MLDTQLILFDHNRVALQPLSFTRPIADLRIGILTIREKWERYLNLTASFATANYLSPLYPTHYGKINLLVNGGALPNPAFCEYLQDKLPLNTLLVQGETPIALKTEEGIAREFLTGKTDASIQVLELPFEVTLIERPWHLFSKNAAALADDFALVTKGRTSQPLSDSNRLIGDPDQLFIEEGAWIEAATLNTQNGPIYIGKNALVMEGSLVRGGLAMCEHAVLKMGAKIYGATTLGPYAKMGGELNNVVVWGYSNKGHEGFLGNAVLGQWCNLGADTNSSNLKNNYANVRVWDYETQRFAPVDLQFCGLIMGDHSKTGINTMFNTATVVGVFGNIFGSDFPRKFIPSFTWGSVKGYSTYQIKKAIETAERVMKRRDKVLSEAERVVLHHIFEQTASYRRY